MMEKTLSTDQRDAGGFRELHSHEVRKVGGGVLPGLLWAGAVVGHTKVIGVLGGTITMSKGVALHAITAFGLAGATYEAAKAYGAAGKGISASFIAE